MGVRRAKEGDLERISYIIGIAFSLDEEKVKIWRDYIDLETIRVYEEDGEIKSVLLLLPFETFIRGKTLKAGGVAYVGTPPEYRRRGYIRELMRGVLNEMHEDGYAVSYLYPFSYDFYRKFGYEHSGDYKWISFKPQDVKVEGENLRIRPGGKDDIEVLNRIYEKFIRNYNCGIRREKKRWLQDIIEPIIHDRKRRWIYIVEEEEPVGYLIFSFERRGKFERYLKVNDYAFVNRKAFLSILHCLSKMGDQVVRVEMVFPLDFPVEEFLSLPGRERKLLQGFMARVVNLKNAVELLNYEGDGILNLKINDPILERNNRIFKIVVRNGRAAVSEGNSTDIEMNINAFTSIFTGFLSLDDLLFSGKVKIYTERGMQLGKLFQKKMTYLVDFF